MGKAWTQPEVVGQKLLEEQASRIIPSAVSAAMVPGYSGLILVAACLIRSRFAAVGPAAAAGQAGQSASAAAAAAAVLGTYRVVQAGSGSLAPVAAEHIPSRTLAEVEAGRIPFRVPAPLRAYQGSHVAHLGPESEVVDSGSGLAAVGPVGNHQTVAVAHSLVGGRGIGSVA